MTKIFKKFAPSQFFLCLGILLGLAFIFCLQPKPAKADLTAQYYYYSTQVCGTGFYDSNGNITGSFDACDNQQTDTYCPAGQSARNETPSILDCSSLDPLTHQEYDWNCVAEAGVCSADPQIACTQNSDCNHSNPNPVCATSVCNNPGQTNSYCSYDPDAQNYYQDNLNGQCVLTPDTTTVCTPGCTPTPDSYAWQIGSYGICSVPTCGGGTQTRSVYCEDTTASTTVANSYCDGGNSASDPATSQTCNTGLCPGPVNGACDPNSNGHSFSSAPSSLCYSGSPSPSSLSGSGPWSWNCNGSNGGSNASCSATQTQQNLCGNGVIDSGEQCDTSNFNGQSCSSLGYTGGSLLCNSNCTLNTSACTSTSNPSNPPTANAYFNPPSVPLGSGSTLYWSCGGNTTSAQDPLGGNTLSGSQYETFSGVGTYYSPELSCTGPGGTATAQAQLSVYPPVSCSPSSQTVGVGQNASLSASGGTGSYTWSAPGSQNPSGSGSSISVSYLGTSSYSVEVSDSGGENAVCGVTVTSGASPPACSTWTLPPSGSFDFPYDNTTVSGVVEVQGWALDNSSNVEGPIASVQLLVDGHAVGSVTNTYTRNDVCAAYPGRVGCPNVGYYYNWDSTSVANGTHTLAYLITDSDCPAHTTTVSTTINVNNSAPPTCTPNSRQSCGSGSCGGTETCNSSGSAWGACSTDGNSCSSGNTCLNGQTCSSGSCQGGSVVSGSHSACSGSQTCVSAANTSSACTSSCSTDQDCGACYPLTYQPSTSGFSTSSSGPAQNTISLNPAQTFYTFVDYGQADIDSIQAPNSGSNTCSWTGWLGTAAVFQCTAPAVGSYTYQTGLNSGTSSNDCAQSNQTVGSSNGVTVVGSCNASAVGTNQMQGCQFNSLDLSGSTYGNSPSEPLVASPADNSTPLPDNNIGAGVNGLTSNYSMRWKGTFNFTGGSYTFTYGSDDGIRIYIDDDNDNSPDSGYLVNNWNYEGYSVQTATVNIPAGQHQIDVEYFQGGGGAEYSLAWSYNAPTPTPTPTATPTPASPGGGGDSNTGTQPGNGQGGGSSGSGSSNVQCATVRLSWTDNSTDETGFKIYMDGVYQLTAPGSSPASQTGELMTYDFTPPDNNPHTYTIAATGPGGDSSQVAESNGSIASLPCGAGNLSTSSKDIIAVNGTSYTGNTCGGTLPLPSTLNLKLGDKLTFQINLCNTGNGTSSSISITDNLTNLDMASGESNFNASYNGSALTYDGASGGSSCTPAGVNHYCAYGTAPDQSLVFNLSSSSDNVGPSGGGSLTYDAQIGLLSGFTGSTGRFQNGFSVGYNSGSGPGSGSVSSYTPLLLFSTGIGGPSINEVP